MFRIPAVLVDGTQTAAPHTIFGCPPQLGTAPLRLIKIPSLPRKALIAAAGGKISIGIELTWTNVEAPPRTKPLKRPSDPSMNSPILTPQPPPPPLLGTFFGRAGFKIESFGAPPIIHPEIMKFSDLGPSPPHCGGFGFGCLFGDHSPVGGKAGSEHQLHFDDWHGGTPSDGLLASRCNRMSQHQTRSEPPFWGPTKSSPV